MPKTILIVGFGPGVSTAVAEKFGAEGFSLALIARNQVRLASGVDALRAQGLAASGYPADAGDLTALRGAMARVRAEFGPIGVIHWNAYNRLELGDLMLVDPKRLLASFDLAVASLLSAVQEALPDLKAARDGAILVTNGAYGESDPMFDSLALASKAEDVALGNAAKAKLVGLLAARLKNEGVYVGEATIARTVSRPDSSRSDEQRIRPRAIAEAFWGLYRSRDEVRARIG